jgi:hypothetical protein
MWQPLYGPGFVSDPGLEAGFGAGFFGVGLETPMLIST